MPRYRFTGDWETVLMGLSHGVNAELHREEHGQPDGSTVVALPGDEVTTVEPYPHAFLVEVDGSAAPEVVRKPSKPRKPRAQPPAVLEVPSVESPSVPAEGQE